VFVSDLRHFLDMPEDVPVPARRIAEHLTLIVRAATAGEGGQPWVSALPCRRRPGRRPCPGHFALLRADVPPSIEWRCTACGAMASSGDGNGPYSTFGLENLSLSRYRPAGSWSRLRWRRRFETYVS
jgi:hypothetical protein